MHSDPIEYALPDQTGKLSIQVCNMAGGFYTLKIYMNLYNLISLFFR